MEAALTNPTEEDRVLIITRTFDAPRVLAAIGFLDAPAK